MSFGKHWKAAGDFWNRNTRSHRIESSQGGTARDIWDQGATYLTKRAAANNLDKPGGTVKEMTDSINRPDFSDYVPTGGSEADPKEPGTKATLARSRRDLFENSNKNRRIIAHTDVNKTKGKKAKTLSRIRGGR